MHVRVAMLGPAAQGLLADLPDPFDDGVLGLITDFECLRAVFNFVKQRSDEVIKLRLALEARDQAGGGGE